MIKEVKGDITKIEADVIINAVNTELIHTGGVALAIAQSALKAILYLNVIILSLILINFSLKWIKT